jgi:hypothetical protein
MCALLLAFCVTFAACNERAFSSRQADTPSPSTESASLAQNLQVAAGEKIPLKILYVGLSGTEREKDFVSFLSKHFTQVKSLNLYTIREEQTQGSDVVILDKDGIQWSSEGGRPLSDLTVSRAYTKPTVSLGVPGAFWTLRMRLKTGYM